MRRLWGLVLDESNKDPVRAGGNSMKCPSLSGETPYPSTIKEEHILKELGSLWAKMNGPLHLQPGQGYSECRRRVAGLSGVSSGFGDVATLERS